MGGEGLDIFIPITLTTDGAGIEHAIKNVIELHKKTGFDTFLLSAPSKGWRSVGYPPREEFEKIAQNYLTFKEGVRDYPITLGWWSLITLKTGPAEFQRIINIDGLANPISTCPLDKAFLERFSSDVASVAELAKPELIIFEDDFGLNCHNGPACFCDLHRRFFAERVGRLYTREELQALFQEESESSMSLRREWDAMSRDSLVQFADRVRKAVDQVAPWIPMGAMQPGCADWDGDSTEAVARAFAGDKHRPFIRLFGTSYCSDDSFALPRNVFHALYCKQHLPEDVVCYHESDTYPHNRFFMSAGKMRSLMGAVYSYGFAGSTFQACQHLDAPNEEVGYHEMFMEERERFQALAKLSRRCDVSGCGLLSAPKLTNEWVSAFAHFGIPYSTKESAVNVLSGTLPDNFSDSEIAELLKHGLLLDGEAAERLCARGFEAAIGVSVKGKAAITDPGRDLAGQERIRERFIRADQDGRLMAWFANYSPYGNGNMHHLVPNNSSTEIVTDLLNFRDEVLGVGMTRFQNADGGRILVMGMSVTGNVSSSLFNYRRSRLLQDLIVWAGAKDLVFVRNLPKMFCILNQPQDSNNGDLAGLVTLINLCSDTCDSVELYIPHAWRGSTTVTYLTADGKWQEVTHAFLDETVRVEHPMQLYHPLYLRFTKINT